jgi:hypothetical protein
MYQQTHVQCVKYCKLFVHTALLHVSSNVRHQWDDDIRRRTLRIAQKNISCYIQNNISVVLLRYSWLSILYFYFILFFAMYVDSFVHTKYLM